MYVASGASSVRLKRSSLSVLAKAQWAQSARMLRLHGVLGATAILCLERILSKQDADEAWRGLLRPAWGRTSRDGHPLNPYKKTLDKPMELAPAGG